MPLTDREVPARMRIIHHCVSLNDVMRDFVDGFKPDIWKYEYFCDVTKGQVIFEFYIEGAAEAKDAQS